MLLAYSKGIVRSRDIEAACRDNVVFIAMSGDSHPHYTTIAQFVATLSEPVADVFTQVLTVCDREGLIGRQMFAIDGVKLPSNAAKSRSGTRAEFIHQADKIRKHIAKVIERQRALDQSEAAPCADAERQARQLDRLTGEAQQIERWLHEHPHDRSGARNGVRQSNVRTTNRPRSPRIKV